MMIKKIKFKQVCAGLLSVTLLTMAVLPHIAKKEAKAFSSAYGVCIDNHNFSTSGAWSKNDKYSNKMINMNDVQNTYGYGSPEYQAALDKNVETLYSIIGSDDDQLLKLFWAGVNTFVTVGKTFGANAEDLAGARYWIDYAQKGYVDSVFHNYAPKLPSVNFVPMNEAELGTVLHGASGQNLVDRDPFLKILSNSHTLFPTVYDPNRNYDTDPLALPRLGNAWLNSYGAQQEGGGGRAQWPKDSPGHEIAGSAGFTPTYEQVQQAALDMDSNEAYKVEGKENTYRIEMTEDFFNNAATGLMGWDDTTQSWRSVYGGINGWECRWLAQAGYWAYEFEYMGGNKPTSLMMYFQIPQNSVASANQIGFNSPAEFVARFTNIYTADACGGTHPGSRTLAQHQRHVSFYFDENPSESYPCFRLGDPTIHTEIGDATVNFDIYRHTEDWTSNYNVQLEKKDFETGQPLQNSIFELYERFDDKDEINRDNDGAVELYEGGDSTWQSKYTTSSVVWDDFRLVGSYTTDSEGKVEDDVKKGYHYEKTFCDGHPAPLPNLNFN